MIEEKTTDFGHLSACQSGWVDDRTSYTIYLVSGFSFQKGRDEVVRTQSWATTACEEIPLHENTFYPDKPIHVQMSVNHFSFTHPDWVHEAAVSWGERVGRTSFMACVSEAGRNERRKGDNFATVDWLAYQGAPDGGVAGEVDMPTWWTGSSCQTVKLPDVSVTPPVLFRAAKCRERPCSVWLFSMKTQPQYFSVYSVSMWRHFPQRFLCQRTKLQKKG